MFADWRISFSVCIHWVEGGDHWSCCEGRGRDCKTRRRDVLSPRLSSNDCRSPSILWAESNQQNTLSLLIRHIALTWNWLLSGGVWEITTRYLSGLFIALSVAHYNRSLLVSCSTLLIWTGKPWEITTPTDLEIFIVRTVSLALLRKLCFSLVDGQIQQLFFDKVYIKYRGGREAPFR